MTSNDRRDITTKIEAALSEVLMREISGLPEETRLFEDLQLDSTTVLELLMALEDRIGFEVDPDNLDMADFETIGTLADYVGAALNVRV
jgi:acyl carrier protein